MHRALVAVVLAACGGGAAAAPQPVTLVPPSTSAAAPAPSASSSDMCTSAPTSPPCSTSPAHAPLPPGPKLCGCALCAPVLSDDACKVDSDCLPATPCHATLCVGAAHAQPRSASLACTQELRCDAIDANRCACVRGRCALAPK